MIPKLLKFKDLKDAGIVANWTTLYRRIKHEGFPPGIKLGAPGSSSTRAWTEESIADWLASRSQGKGRAA